MDQNNDEQYRQIQRQQTAANYRLKAAKADKLALTYKRMAAALELLKPDNPAKET